MVFCILAFVGFEAAAPLGEETREPRSTIPRAIILSCLLIGLFYIFCYYAATVYFGPDKMKTDFLGFNGGNPWAGMANHILPTARQPPGHVRDRQQLPRELQRRRDRVDPVDLLARPGGPAATRPSAPSTRRYQTPSLATHVQGVIGIVLAVGLGLLFNGYTSGGPITTYGFIGTMLGLLFAAMYIAVNVGGDRLLPRRSAGATSTSLKHIVVPILGIAARWSSASCRRSAGVSIPILGVDLPPLPEPYNYRAARRRRLDAHRAGRLLRAPGARPGGDRASSARPSPRADPARRRARRVARPRALSRRSTAGSGP